MPFILLFAGVLLLVVSIRNQQTPFVQLIKSDFTGPHNFLYWVVALVVIGAIGYIPKARPVANLLLVLIIIALILTRGKGGLFQNLTSALGTTTAQQTGTTVAGVGSTVGQLTQIGQQIAGSVQTQ